MAGLGTGLGVVLAIKNNQKEYYIEPTEAGHISM